MVFYYKIWFTQPRLLMSHIYLCYCYCYSCHLIDYSYYYRFNYDLTVVNDSLINHYYSNDDFHHHYYYYQHHDYYCLYHNFLPTWFFSWKTTVKIKVPACVVPSLLFDIYCIFLSWLLAKVCLSLTFWCSCTFPLVTVINGYVFIWYFIYSWWWSITHILNKILYLIQVLHLTYFFSLLVHNDVMTSNLWL